MRRPSARGALTRVWSFVKWLRSRHGAQALARAVATNQIATAALAASVATAGVGGYATYQNVQQGHQIASQAAALDHAQAALTLAQTQLTALKADTAALKVTDAKQIAALDSKLLAQSASLASLASRVASTPSLAGQVSKLAAATSLAAQQAQLALIAARGASDPAARDAAAKAQLDAAAAQKAADAAQVTADAEKYAPVVYSYPDGTTDYFRQVDVSNSGTYLVTLAASGEGFIGGSIQGNNVPLGTTTFHLDATETFFNLDVESPPATGVSLTLQLVRP